MASGKTLKTTLLLAGKLDASYGKALKAAEKAAKATGGKIGSAMKVAGQVGAKTVMAVAAGATAATLAIGAFGAAAVQNAATMEASMANVGTLLDGTAEEVKARTQELSADVIRVSNDTGIATAELSAGLYDVISAVGDTEDSIKIMEIAAKAAAAGNAETAEAVSLLTAVTKGYGDTSGEAFQKASDLAFQTVKLGQTTFPELAASIGKVTPLASALGVQQEELFGVFATLTGVTGSAAEVSTQYKAVLSGLMTPSKSMAASLEALGYSTGSAAIEALGFQGTLDALMGTVDGDTQSMAKLFSSVEAQTAILSLCGAQSENLTNKTEAMMNATNATNTAFETQTDTLEYSLQKIKNLGQNFMTQVGQKILPSVASLAEKALPMISQAMDNIMPAIEGIANKAGPIIENIASKVGPVLLKGIEAIPGAITKVGSIANAIYSKIKPYLIEASKLIAYIPGIFESISAKAQALAPVIEPVLQAIIGKVQEFAPIVIGMIGEAIGYIMRIGEVLAPIIGVLVATLSPVLQEIFPILRIIWDVAGELVSCLEAMKPTLIIVAGVIGTIASAIAGSLISACKSAWNILGEGIKIVKEFFSIINNLAAFIGNVLTGNFRAAFGNLAEIVRSAFGGVKAAINAGIQAIVAPINALIDGANKAIDVVHGKRIPRISVQAFAKGATVTEPTLAWIAEAGETETVVPHNNSPRSRALLAEAEKGVYGSSSGGKHIEFTYAPVINGAGGSIKEELREDYERFKEFMSRYAQEDDREVFA